MKKYFLISFLLISFCGANTNENNGSKSEEEISLYSTPQELAWCSIQLEELADEYITNLDIYELTKWSNKLSILEEVIPMSNLTPVDVWYHEDKKPTKEDKIETHLSGVKRRLVSDKLYETSSKMLQPVTEYDRLCNFWRANYEKSK